MYERHGMTNTRLYRIWGAMKTRCYDIAHPHYNDYGGRGIKVCDEWRSFPAFSGWALSNGYTDELTIDRVDANGNYCPENCRWVTMKEQGNNKRNNIVLTHNGKTQTLSNWAKETGIDYHKLFMRVSRGWSAERALSKP